MSDMPSIYEIGMIQDEVELEQDILSGRAMDILLCMMDNAETASEMARRIGIPIYSVQLYLQRLLKAKLIRSRFELFQVKKWKKHTIWCQMTLI